MCIYSRKIPLKPTRHVSVPRHTFWQQDPKEFNEYTIINDKFRITDE